MYIVLFDIIGNESQKNYFEINAYKNVISIKLKYKYLDLFNSVKFNLFKKIKSYFVISKFENKIKKLIKKDNKEKFVYIFSKILEKDYINKEAILKYIVNSLFKNSYEIKNQNQMQENFEEYIESYLQENNIKKENVKILYILDGCNHTIYDNILKNINKYKYIDISYISNKNNIRYIEFKKKIDNINNELGSAIDFINLNYNMDYNIYLNFSSIDCSKSYNISNKNLILDWYKEENDIYNTNNIIFEKNLYKINKIFNILEIDVKNFNKTKIGFSIKNKLIEI